MSFDLATRLRNIIRGATSDLADRYALNKIAFRGAFVAALYSPHVPSVKAQMALTRELSRLSATAIASERAASVEVTMRLMEEFDSENPSLTGRAASNLLKYQRYLARQISHDARVVDRKFKQAQMVIYSSQSANKSAIQSLAIERLNDEKTFQFKDKAGKFWKSEYYIATRATQYYYGLVNDVIVNDLRIDGRETVVLSRPGHHTNGLTIAIDALDQAKNKYFHPGSEAIVT